MGSQISIQLISQHGLFYVFCIISQRLLLIPHGTLNKKAYFCQNAHLLTGLITYNILIDYSNQLHHFVHTNELVENAILIEAGVNENVHTFNDQCGDERDEIWKSMRTLKIHNFQDYSFTTQFRFFSFIEVILKTQVSQNAVK